MADPHSAAMAQDPAASRLDPFGATLGVQGIYISQTLQQRLDLIEHLLEFGRQIIVLNGASGSGKSTLLGYLSAGQGRNWYCIRIPVGPTLNVRGLEQLIIRELDIEHSDEVELRTVIRLRLGALEQAGKVAVLLFDDAEHLTPEVINAIVTLANTEDKLAEFRVLLAADLDHSALLENLQREAPQHGLVHVVEIPRLTAAQVQALIAHRLHGTDVHADDYFSAADYARLTTEAQGLTGHVVTLARQQLAERTRSGGHAHSAGTRVAWVRKLAFTALGLGAIAGGAWLANRHAEPGAAGDPWQCRRRLKCPRRQHLFRPSHRLHQNQRVRCRRWPPNARRSLAFPKPLHRPLSWVRSAIRRQRFRALAPRQPRACLPVSSTTRHRPRRHANYLKVRARLNPRCPRR